MFLTAVGLIGLGISFLTKHYSEIRIAGYVNQDISRIHLNQADKEALIDVPGIGEKLAQRIIDCRKQRGEFSDISQLKDIKGIGDYKYKAIKDYFIVD